MRLNDQEKARTRYFLGYPNWGSMTSGIHMGFPVGSQALYLVEQAFERLTDDGLDSVRSCLAQLEQIEAQMISARGRARAEKIGDIVPNPKELSMLWDERRSWVLQLAGVLGTEPNPYAATDALGGARCGGRA